MYFISTTTTYWYRLSFVHVEFYSDLEVDGDGKHYSEDEDNETAQDKRLRIAKQYLSTLKAEGRWTNDQHSDRYLVYAACTCKDISTYISFIEAEKLEDDVDDGEATSEAVARRIRQEIVSTCLHGVLNVFIL